MKNRSQLFSIFPQHSPLCFKYPSQPTQSHLLSNPIFSTHTQTHIHYSLSAEFQTLCLTCLFSRYEGGKEVLKKKRLHIPVNTCLQGEGIRKRRRGRTGNSASACFTVCSTGKQCHHMVQLHFTARKINKITGEFTLHIVKQGTPSDLNRSLI